MKNWKIWLQSARPQTLAASVVPVIAGGALAWSHSGFILAVTLTALFCAVTIQIGTNFANDYYDFKKGADNDERIGFERATASGLIQPKSMLTATVITMTIAFLAGIYLIWVGGWVIFWIGILSIFFGILYTGGPYPLGYNGLGDLFVFLFFGFVAVIGTYYVNTLTWSDEAFWVSIPIGALCVNILVVNNLRDINQDRTTGKRTLGVIFGEDALKMEYLLMLLIAFAILPILYLYYDYGIAIFLPLLGLPFLYDNIRSVFNHSTKQELNDTLEKTARFMALYGVLFAVGIVLQTH